MRLKSWLWVSAFALFINCVTAFASGRDQDRGDHSRDSREAIGNTGRGFPDDNRGWGNNEQEREWREYLKEQKKAYKEWAKASSKEQKDFEKYLRENRKNGRDDFRDRERELRETDREQRENVRERESYRWEDQRERDREWKEYLKERKRAFKDYSRASRWELNDFEDYLRGRGYRYENWGSNREPRNGACFYTNTNYGGERFCLNDNERISFVGNHYNDRISSIRIFGRARVTIYRNKNYGGSHRTYTDDAPHLGDFNEEISSIKMK